MNPYTLWLAPPKDIADKYQHIIDTYCKQFNIHTFLPHITLVGGIDKNEDEIASILNSILAKPKPIDITISEVSISTTYFQCVFGRVEPSPALLDLHLNLKEVLNMNDEKIFMPHMSLVYADIDSNEKQKIAQEITLPPAQFICDTIYLMESMNKDTSTWRKIKEFTLT